MTDTRNDETTAHLSDLVAGMRIAMVTTPDPAGALRSRPLTLQKVEDDTVWFLVDAGADWIDDSLPSVNVAFSDSGTWVSATGTGRVVRDRAVLDELGDPVSDAWFEEGDDPAGLRIDVERADYWDAPNKVSQLFELGRAALTGSRPDMGERGVVRP